MTVAQAADRVGMSEADLRSVNRIPPRMMIKAGSALMVPRTSQHMGDVASHIADNGKIAFAPEVTNVTRRTSVKVRRGDSMARVARRNGVSVADLARWNSLKTNSQLKAGQSLSIYKTVRMAANTSGQKASKNRQASTTKKPANAKVAQKAKSSTTKKKR